MPTSIHPQAKFDPIPPDLDLHALVDRAPNFEWVLRISTTQIRNLGSQEFEKLVLLHVINGGKPLVIEKWNDVLPGDLFNAKWLEKTYDKKQESVRDIKAQNDIPMTMGHYLRSLKQLASQWTPINYRDDRRQRLYLKDIDCPVEWHDHLQKVIPPNLFYMNTNVTEKGGSGSNNDLFRGLGESTAATAGDLMSSLPEEMRAQNLMCYIGHEGTYTPAHREMCASLGQNIMVEASGDAHGEKPGSSIWFMTETKDREVVREYFLSMLGHDIEIEKHFAQINAWKKATFPVYVVEQRPGDFILIPPLAPHQVWNRGTRTMKVAWNRTTVETLDMALHEALPKARLVCRDEQYKNKAIIYYTLKKYYQDMADMEENAEMSFLGFGQELLRNSARSKQMATDFRRLFYLFTEILTDEMFAYKEKNVEYIEFDSSVTCSYCRSNIFNRFLTCKHCIRTLVDGDEDAYDVCMECYAMGRSCVCLSGLQWCEQWEWTELVNNYEIWRSMVIKNDGFVDLEVSPQPLEIARERRNKRSVAQICQDSLRRRPFKDITKPDREKTPSESEPDLDDEGRPKKKKTKRRLKKGDVRRCHVCCHKDYSYKVHECTVCKDGYCYGVLYRAFDLMPQTVMEDENWKCPKCLKICNCGACRRTGNTNPYTPKNTLLGHDTRPIADDRSIEALVDFRVHNLNWLKAAGEEGRSRDSRRMQNLRKEADVAKAQDDPVPATEQAVSNGTNDIGTGETGGANGYGDQSHLLDPHPSEDFPMGNGDPLDGHHERPEHGELMPFADMSFGGEDADESSYPDPMMMGVQRMLGMGYYEQDAGPDQILFDPFQMPTAESLALETEESEFVKKSLRAAKRKAKLLNENDPDFMQPKSHKKKSKADPPDMSTLDPALFNTFDSAEPDKSAMDITPLDEESAEPTAQLELEAEEHAERESPKQYKVPMFPANVPALRHARPRASYVETDELVVDSPDDIVPAKPAPVFRNDEPDNSVKNPLDMASDALRALLNKPVAAEASAQTPTTAPKRRGRPPKSATTPAAVTPASSSKKSDKPITPTFGSIARRPGRPARRSAFSNVEVVENEDGSVTAEDSNAEDKAGAQPDTEAPDNVDDDDDDFDIAIDELEAELARDLEKEQGIAENAYPKPPSDEPAPPRQRGRPPKSATAPAAPSSTQKKPEPAVRGAPVAHRFLSMAERMALSGKKFKMTKRRSGGETSKDASRKSVTPARNESREASAPLSGNKRQREPVDDDFSPEPEEVLDDASSASPSPTPARIPTRNSGGPTVVRLGSDELSSDAVDTIDSDSGSDDDEDGIPATVSTPRGRGRGGSGMGRGGARGRPRGRPRGRGRM